MHMKMPHVWIAAASSIALLQLLACATTADAFMHSGRVMSLRPHVASQLCDLPTNAAGLKHRTDPFYRRGAKAATTTVTSGDAAASTSERQEAGTLDHFDCMNHDIKSKVSSMPFLRSVTRSVFGVLAAMSISTFSPSVSAV